MNVYVRELSSALARAGIECDVYTRRWRTGLPPVVQVESGFRVHHVDAGPPEIVERDCLPDLVDEFTGGVLDAVNGGEAPDVIHANYWLSGVSGHALKHKLDLPLVSTFHTLARVKADAGVDDDPAQRARVEQETIACTDLILASTADEREQLVGLYGAERDRIEIVPPGVDHEIFSPASPAARAAARAALDLDDRPVVLFVGRIQPLKGPDLLLQAAARMLADDPGLRAKLQVLVVGAPSGSGLAEPRRLQELAVSLGVTDVVRFLPPQPPEQLAEHYRAADVAVVPSHNESFGLVALEAQACGTPVVAAAVGGLHTAVDDGVSGLLVAGRDSSSYAAAIRRVLAGRELLAAGARRHASRFSWDRTVDSLVDAYAAAMAEMSQRSPAGGRDRAVRDAVRLLSGGSAAR